MNNSLTVFNFELRSILRKRSVIITTIIMALFMLIATCIPSLINLFASDDTTVVDDSAKIGIIFESDEITAADLSSYLGNTLSVYTSEEQLRSDVQNGAIGNGFIIHDISDVTSIVENKDLYSYADETIVSILQNIYRNRELTKLGIDPTTVDTLSNLTINVDDVVLGKDASNTFLLSYILMFAVYFLVIMYGSFVSTSVAREKDNRTMEILITSTSPRSLIVGKVFANAIGGLLQFGVVIVAGLIGYLLNKASYPAYIIDMLFSGLTADGLIVFLIFTASGYLLYLFLYAALGSLVSKVEDVGSSVSPIMMLFMVGYIISAIGINTPDSMLMKIGSYVPFTAILVMPIRYFLTAVPWLELVISMILMVLTAVLLAHISIKIYRLGSLTYGNKISFIKAIKMIFAKDNIDLQRR